MSKAIVDWKARLQESKRKTVEGILEHGKLIYEYKQSCEKSHYSGTDFGSNIKEWLGYSPSTSTRWVQIGQNLDSLFPIGKSLPSSLSTILEIAKLTPLQMEYAKQKGYINPNVTVMQLTVMQRRMEAEDKEGVDIVEEEEEAEKPEPIKPKPQTYTKIAREPDPVAVTNRLKAIRELGLNEFTDLSEIEAWPPLVVKLINRELAKKYHPDKGASKKKAARYSQLINALKTDIEDIKL